MMALFAPDYYTAFRCSASDCRHSCCKGWEIDIDPVSLERFKRLGIDCVSEEGTPHFILREGDICPHLQEDGLCALICAYGEDVLCDICRDHPRFRNFWTGAVEVGLGLSCEEAARLTLSRKEPLRLVYLGGCDESGLLLKASPGAERREERDADPSALPARLPEDEAWLWELRESMLKEAAMLEDPMAARLAEYLIFRHLADALYDGRLEGRLGFIRHSLKTVTGLWREQEDKSFEALCETARAWSERFEYDEEEKDRLIDSFEEG